MTTYLDKFYDGSGKALRVTVLVPGHRVRVHLEEKWAEYELDGDRVHFIGMHGFSPQYGAPRGAFTKAYQALTGRAPVLPTKPKHTKTRGI